MSILARHESWIPNILRSVPVPRTKKKRTYLYRRLRRARFSCRRLRRHTQPPQWCHGACHPRLAVSNATIVTVPPPLRRRPWCRRALSPRPRPKQSRAAVPPRPAPRTLTCLPSQSYLLFRPQREWRRRRGRFLCRGRGGGVAAAVTDHVAAVFLAGHCGERWRVIAPALAVAALAGIPQREPPQPPPRLGRARSVQDC